MKKLALVLILMSSFAFGQMPNIESVWMNNSKPYLGTIGKENQGLKLKINLSEQDKKNDQAYFISGNSVVDTTVANFEGKLKITKYKDSKKKGNVYGEYEMAEEPKGKHSGIFKGTFVYTFNWNDKDAAIENHQISFQGTWTSYDGTFSFPTKWTNK